MVCDPIGAADSVQPTKKGRMNYLIEIKHPCGCWKDFLVKRRVTLREVIALVAEHYQGDEIHDVRIKRLKNLEQLRRAIKNVQHNWRKYGHQGGGKGRRSRREH